MDLKKLEKMCRNFLWSGDGSQYKLPKVAWGICSTSKEEGGLGIPNLNDLADKMVSKWTLRSFLFPNEPWSMLLHRKCKDFSIQEYPKWKGLDLVNLAFCSMNISPSGSPLVKGIWSSWNRLKPFLIPKINVRYRGQWLHLDFVWYNIVHRTLGMILRML